MISPVQEMVLLALRGGMAVERIPPQFARCIGELALLGLLAVAPTDRDASSVTAAVTRDVTVPMTPAERAKRARLKRKAERDAAAVAVTVERDETGPIVTAERDASRDASRSLSLSSPLNSLPSSDSAPSEALGDLVACAREVVGAAEPVTDAVTLTVTSAVTPTVTGRTDHAAVDARDAVIGRKVRAAYGRRWERDFRDPCSARPTDDEMRSVVRWVAAQPDPDAAIERFIDGAFTAPKWRKPTCRAPWRWISEDPGATAAFSTKPSASAAQAGPRPRLPRQELPTEPTDAKGAF